MTEVFSWHPHGILFFYLPKAAILSEELGWGLVVYKNNDGVNSNKSPVVAGTWGKEGGETILTHIREKCLSKGLI